MPANKLQHFVPRVLLKRFACSSNQRAVSLFNFRTGLTVNSAPLRGQCAKSYLYGKDPRLEKELSSLEGFFGRVSSKVIETSDALTHLETEYLRLFAVIQMFRTEQAIERTRSMFQSMHVTMFEGVENSPDVGDMSDTALAVRNVEMAKAFYPALTDLKLCIIENCTQESFLASDSPALTTNRLYLQRYKTGNFGLGQAGCIIYLPLSPARAILFYDVDVYSIRKAHRVQINASTDVHAFNVLTVQEARSNLYFTGDGDKVSSFVNSVRDGFIPRWHSNTVYAPVQGGPDSEVYRKVDNTYRQEGSMLYVSSVFYPDPKRWASVLRYRPVMTAYTNGSSVGYVRRHTAALDRTPVRKVNLSRAPHPITSDQASKSPH